MNILELVVNTLTTGSNREVRITDAAVMGIVQEKIALYDKSGEQHYDIISAFIKSLRGSDPNAAVYWLARMVEGGEDPKFIARRMVILAAEDIGLANPNALLLASACFQAINLIGWPESRIILSETAIYLATSPKSNSAYIAINNALEMVRETGDLPVPLGIRNAPTSLMKELGYGADYKYAHDYEGNFTQEEFLPEAIRKKILYAPQENSKEKEIRNRLAAIWKNKYNY
jgi:putative ATPase